VEQAGVMETLLEDPRYHDYKQLLEEARESLVNQLVYLRHEGLDREEYDHAASVLQGRIIQLDAILTTPETFIARADAGDTANGQNEGDWDYLMDDDAVPAAGGVRRWR